MDRTHAPATSNTALPERFARKVTTAASGCWPWTGHIDHGGYGRLGGLRAHRAVYEAMVGPIPEGMQLDHLCHTADLSCAAGVDCAHRRCVNPAHLEPVTGRVNTLRGRSPSAKHAAKTHCNKGHLFDEVNTRIGPSGARVCRQCDRLKGRSRSHQERQKGRSKLAPGDSRHGTKSAYVNNGCRCAPCTEANTAYYRDLRARRRPSPDGA